MGSGTPASPRPAEPRTDRRCEPRAEIGVLALFLGLTVLLFAKAWVAPTRTWIGLTGDPPQYMWYLRWVPYALSHHHAVLVSNYLNFPDGINLMWSTSLVLPALVLAPLTLTFGPILAYNVLITLAVALSGWCAFLMLRRYVDSRVAAFVGGALYGFSPYVLSQAREHAHMPLAFVPPLMLLLLDEILVRQRRGAVRTGALLGVLAAAQLLISEELLASEAVVAALALVLLVLLHPRQAWSRARLRHGAVAVAVAAAVSLGIAAVPLLTQFRGEQRVLSGRLWGPDFFASDVLEFVVPTPHQQLSPARAEAVTRTFQDACCQAEWGAYLGVPLIALLLFAFYRLWRRPLVRFAGFLLVSTMLLSMGPHLHVAGTITRFPLPFWLIARLPVFGNILPVRLMVYGYLMAAIIVAVFLDRALAWPRPGPAQGVVAVALALVPLFPALSMPASRTSTPGFFTDGARLVPRGSVAVVAPFARDTATSAPMLWQAESGMRFRMPEGYALGPDRSGHYSFLPIATALSTAMEHIQRGQDPGLTDDLRREIELDLVVAQVDSVIVGPTPNREAMVELFRSLLGREPERVRGVELWRGLRLRPMAQPPR